MTLSPRRRVSRVLTAVQDKLTPNFHAALSHCLIDSAVFGLLSLSLFTALLSTGENLACEVVESDEELSIFARWYVVKKNCPHNVERSL